MMLYCGGDVGRGGALAIISEDGYVDIVDFDKDAIIHKLTQYKKEIKMLCLEKVSSRPMQGVVSVFSFGENFGWWQGVLDTLEIPYDLVRPQEWMKGNVPAKPTKHDIHDVAKRLYPTAQLVGSKGGIKDGRSDALMIAHYCRKTYR